MRSLAGKPTSKEDPMAKQPKLDPVDQRIREASNAIWQDARLSAEISPDRLSSEASVSRIESHIRAIASEIAMSKIVTGSIDKIQRTAGDLAIMKDRLNRALARERMRKSPTDVEVKVIVD